MFRNKNGFIITVALLGFVGTATQVAARPNVNFKSTINHKEIQLKTTATCQPATYAIDLDINNVRARLMDGGDMWWNQGTQVAAYEIPKDSKKSSQFAASCWIGGYDAQGQLKVAAQTYRQDGNDYWPGILDGSNSISASDCLDWDYMWKVNKSDIQTFISLYKSGGSGAVIGSQFDVINHWPAAGNTTAKGANGATLSLVNGRTYAPFVDLNNNGRYEPSLGEYPDIKGDQYIWWVFNDKGNIKGQSQTAAIGLEVQTSAFAYASQDFLNDATFGQYRVINRGNFQMDSTYIAVWDDCDLGWAFDDYIGCDSSRGLGIDYNGKSFDGSGQVNSYGSVVPQVGLDFFQGPKKTFHNAVTNTDSIGTLSMTNFTYYNNDGSQIGNPTNGIEIYGYMTGTIRDGSHFTDDFVGYGTACKGYGSGPITHFVYSGDPSFHNQWSECACNNAPGDRRMIFSAGPFTLKPGAANDIIFGCVWVPDVGGCPNTSFKSIQAVDDQAQALFDNGFKTIEGPNAPVLVCRELDKHLIFYITNPYGSNNYKEQFGYSDSAQYQQSAIKPAKILHNKDSLYKFQGYRVFQLADGSVSPAQIYGSDGTVDQTKAIEVFECDIHDSITKLVNYVKNTSISDSTWVGQLKVTGKDSGIVHSFEINQDAFASGANKSMVNYKSYYFVAIAYSYLDWDFDKVHHTGGFNSRNGYSDTTQDLPYLESSHGPNSTAIPVVTALPNPANGGVGTVLNSDYGSGVTVTRIVGNGNGGNIVQLDTLSEDTALMAPDYIVKHPVYIQGSAPINVKVVDPVNVQAVNWELAISGPLADAANNPDLGISPNGGTWKLVGKPVAGGSPIVITSERNISILNEQILTDYGLSVSIKQAKRPGDDQANGNGYITSDITFTDPTKPWLAGVPDQADSNQLNWLRSGNNHGFASNNPCNFNDYSLDTNQAYQSLLSNNSLAKSSWGPYALVAQFDVPNSECSFTFAPGGVQQSVLYDLPSVDIVFTSNKSKWTRCVVIEMQEDPNLAEGKASKFGIRVHPSLVDIDANGNPVYAKNAPLSGGLPDFAKDSLGLWGMSWFPGYAVNPETGERLNIAFGEDSWLKSENGADMIWNPTSNLLNTFDGSVIFGGKHAIYVLGNRYDSCRAFKSQIYDPTNSLALGVGWIQPQWVGVPLLNPLGNLKLLSLKDGLIPTTTRIRLRTTRPYSFFDPYRPPILPTRYSVDTANFTSVPSTYDSATLVNHGFPDYTFSTANLAKTALSDKSDKNALLDKIQVVPNPYYGYSGYEGTRFDTKVRITNLPAQTTVAIYSLDGTLVRILSKSDPSVSYLDWDIRNTVGLPVASGMYLMHVKAIGIGETVLKWFGAMRPIDVTTY